MRTSKITIHEGKEVEGGFFVHQLPTNRVDLAVVAASDGLELHYATSEFDETDHQELAAFAVVEEFGGHELQHHALLRDDRSDRGRIGGGPHVLKHVGSGRVGGTTYHVMQRL